MIDPCQAEALEHMVMPGRGCIIFPVGTMPMLELACARRVQSSCIVSYMCNTLKQPVNVTTQEQVAVDERMGSISMH
jgi:glutamate synthase domain-containing protein 2